MARSIAGVKTTIETLKQGTGPQVTAGKSVTVNCTGMVQNGMKKFWR